MGVNPLETLVQPVVHPRDLLVERVPVTPTGGFAARPCNAAQEFPPLEIASLRFLQVFSRRIDVAKELSVAKLHPAVDPCLLVFVVAIHPLPPLGPMANLCHVGFIPAVGLPSAP